MKNNVSSDQAIPEQSSTWSSRLDDYFSSHTISAKAMHTKMIGKIGHTLRKEIWVTSLKIVQGEIVSRNWNVKSVSLIGSSSPSYRASESTNAYAVIQKSNCTSSADKASPFNLLLDDSKDTCIGARINSRSLYLGNRSKMLSSSKAPIHITEAK